MPVPIESSIVKELDAALIELVSLTTSAETRKSLATVVVIDPERRLGFVAVRFAFTSVGDEFAMPDISMN